MNIEKIWGSSSFSEVSLMKRVLLLLVNEMTPREGYIPGCLELTTLHVEMYVWEGLGGEKYMR